MDPIPLDPDNRQARPCKLCGAPAIVFDVVDFNKICSDGDFYKFGLAEIPVRYFRCTACEFLFTPFCDAWSEADFAARIYNDDYLKADPDYRDVRPRTDHATILALLGGRRDLSLLDYGGGAGVLVSLLRDAGVDAELYDPFASPARPTRGFDIVTCFEVIEHAVRPLDLLCDITGLMNPDGCILFSTSVQPPDIARLRANWWYVAPRNGHVSIQSQSSLLLMARQCGLMLHDGPGGRAFTGPAPSAAAQDIVARRGPFVLGFDLFAPSGSATASRAVSAPEQWQAIEQSGPLAVRWTTRPEITWRLAEPYRGPCDLFFRLPIATAIQPGFADGCSLSLGETEHPLQREGDNLVCTITARLSGDDHVTLRTPAPLRPCDLGNSSDSRPLGLAVRACPHPAEALHSALVRPASAEPG